EVRLGEGPISLLRAHSSILENNRAAQSDGTERRGRSRPARYDCLGTAGRVTYRAPSWQSFALVELALLLGSLDQVSPPLGAAGGTSGGPFQFSSHSPGDATGPYTAVATAEAAT